jgi:Glycosyltransferase like family 2
MTSRRASRPTPDTQTQLSPMGRIRRAVRNLRTLLQQLDEIAPLLRQLQDDRSHEQVNAAFEPEITRLAATQALLARVYERGFDWPTLVAAMREEAGYSEAWEGEPLITVRIATYNKAEVLLSRALPSVLRQTYPNWEVIIVGDCCSDDTAERVAALDHPRIRFENLPVRGPYPADPTSLWHTAGIFPMNRGLELAQGAWVAALDDDDAWDDDHLAVLLEEAKRSRAEIVYGKYRLMDAERGRLIAHAFGADYPPSNGAIGFQTALCHGKLSRFRLDPLCYLAGEPGDRNLARRLYESGVRFSALDRVVATYWFDPRTPWSSRHIRFLRDRYGHVQVDAGEEPGSPSSARPRA